MRSGKEEDREKGGTHIGVTHNATRDAPAVLRRHANLDESTQYMHYLALKRRYVVGFIWLLLLRRFLGGKEVFLSRWGTEKVSLMCLDSKTRV